MATPPSYIHTRASLYKRRAYTEMDQRATSIKIRNKEANTYLRVHLLEPIFQQAREEMRNGR